MLVVVALMCRVAAAVMHVIHMVAVRYRDVSAALPMHMVVTFVGTVPRNLTFVEMPVVGAMDMPVVDVIHMISVRHSHVPARLPVDVGVTAVFLMYRRSHRTSSEVGSASPQALIHC